LSTGARNKRCSKASAPVEPLINVVVGDAGRPLWILFGAVSMLLLIACSNVANVLLARASVRQQEMSVRAALDASRGRIVRQLSAESLLLSFIGTGLALLLTRVGLAAFVALGGQAIPRSTEIRLDGSVLALPQPSRERLGSSSASRRPG
jgi:putative ABC transport system permease protein